MNTKESIELMASIEANYCFKNHISMSDLKNHPEATADLLKAYVSACKSVAR